MVFVLSWCYILEMLANYQITVLLMNFKTYSNTGKDTVKSELSQIAGGGIINWHSRFRKHLGNTYQGSSSVLEEEENRYWDFWKAFASLCSRACILCSGWACSCLLSGCGCAHLPVIRTSLLLPSDPEPRADKASLKPPRPSPHFPAFCIRFQSPHATPPFSVW